MVLTAFSSIVALQVVDIGVVGGHPLGERGVALGQRVDRIGDLLLGQAAHLGDHAREILQVAVECLDGVFGHGRHPRTGLRLASALSRSAR